MFKDPLKARNMIHDAIDYKWQGTRQESCTKRLMTALSYASSSYHIEDKRSDLLALTVIYLMDAMWYAKTCFDVDMPVIGGELHLVKQLDAIVDICSTIATMAQRTTDGKNWGSFGLTLMCRGVIEKIDVMLSDKGISMREIVHSTLKELPWTPQK